MLPPPRGNVSEAGRGEGSWRCASKRDCWVWRCHWPLMKVIHRCDCAAVWIFISCWDISFFMLWLTWKQGSLLQGEALLLVDVFGRLVHFYTLVCMCCGPWQHVSRQVNMLYTPWAVILSEPIRATCVSICSSRALSFFTIKWWWFM